MKITENVSLKPFNTFGVDVKAKYFITASFRKDISEAIDFSRENRLPLLPIGKGSNILFTKNYDGVVLNLEFADIKIISENDSDVLLEVSAGVVWDDAVRFAVKNNYWGLENLSLIPGAAGAAPVQNIGAYGAELKDVLESLEAIDIESKEAVAFTNEECKFGYRDSIFKNELKDKFIITGVKLKLSKVSSPNINYRPLKKKFGSRSEIKIEEIRDEVIRIRKEKLSDPKEFGNAGSFFTNPIIGEDELQRLRTAHPSIPFYDLGEQKYKIPAAWLIEKAGLKGYREANVGVSPKQALVILNYGEASGKEVIEFAEKIKNLILKKFNISLQTEVNIL